MHTMNAMHPLFLLTDFGTADPYVAQMKGVILTLAPQARIIDLSHDIRPFAISQAGFFLWAGYDYLPQGSVVVCVVDPGVGTDRRIVLLQCDGRYVLAPDNGLTALLLSRHKGSAPVRVFEIMHGNNACSATFHGRDIFAPLGARLINGALPETLGTRIKTETLVQPSWITARLEGNRLCTHVVHIDRFGNCLLNLMVSEWSEYLQRCAQIRVYPAGRKLHLVTTYGHLGSGELGLLAGSQGVFEICMREESVALELGVCPEDALSCECWKK
ncbi:MAG: SAM-dependent chlorinase/fluorinase [Desulfoplanes sp.]